jgi:hypothetical protein
MRTWIGGAMAAPAAAFDGWTRTASAALAPAAMLNGPLVIAGRPVAAAASV